MLGRNLCDPMSGIERLLEWSSDESFFLHLISDLSYPHCRAVNHYGPSLRPNFFKTSVLDRYQSTDEFIRGAIHFVGGGLRSTCCSPLPLVGQPIVVDQRCLRSINLWQRRSSHVFLEPGFVGLGSRLHRQ